MELFANPRFTLGGGRLTNAEVEKMAHTLFRGGGGPEGCTRDGVAQFNKFQRYVNGDGKGRSYSSCSGDIGAIGGAYVRKYMEDNAGFTPGWIGRGHGQVMAVS